MLEQWRVRDFEPGAQQPDTSDVAASPSGWLDISTPGDIYAALIAARRIEHPYLGRNERAAAWVAEREWWWRTRFDGAAPTQSDERVDLVFEGLDTFASIHLNGTLLGRTDNMFRSWRFEVGALLREHGPNELLVVFDPPSRVVPCRDIPQWGAISEKTNISRRNLMRKAQFGWGWDWGPHLPTVGIWRPVRLERWNQARIDDLRHTMLELSERRCVLRVDLGIEHALEAAGLRAEVRLSDPHGRVVAADVVSLDEIRHTSFVLQRPQLWWTADLGAQPLYTVQVRLLAAGRQLDQRSLRIGLRSIVLDQSPDAEEPGTHFFRFLLNGVPIVARGACWIPPTSFVGITEEVRYRMLLEQAVAANMNMMRVWGGGVYEHDAFYDLCDELGLLVWQDFMFACAPYPEDDAALVETIRGELRDQVVRLRHHASLALWCGNNECQVIQDLMNQLGGTDQPLLGTLYYDRIMPEILAQLDPVTPYWPGSPCGGPSPNSMRAGDVHDWTVWHGFPPVPDGRLVGGLDRSPAGVHFTRYAEDQGRFISEFGIQSAPTMALLRRWMNPEDLSLDCDGFRERIKDEPKDKINAMLLPVTGLPRDLQDYIDCTRLLQAEGLKFGIEHFRRRKPHCSGVLIWQLNDCWPCISWSLIDYDGGAKAALHAVRRAYAPLLASFKPLGGGHFELWITNDTLRPVTGTAIVELLRFAGGADWSMEQRYAVPANSSAPVWRGHAPTEACDRALCVHAADEAFTPNRYLLAPVQALELARGAAPQVSIHQNADNELRVELSADTWLLCVNLETDDPAARFSDNAFDLRPGESRSVTVHAAAPLSPHALRVRCWNQRA